MSLQNGESPAAGASADGAPAANEQVSPWAPHAATGRHAHAHATPHHAHAMPCTPHHAMPPAAANSRIPSLPSPANEPAHHNGTAGHALAAAGATAPLGRVVELPPSPHGSQTSHAQAHDRRAAPGGGGYHRGGGAGRRCQFESRRQGSATISASSFRFRLEPRLWRGLSLSPCRCLGPGFEFSLSLSLGLAC